MDCIIPGHSVRTFSAAVACLTKIGKELYIDYDPLDGLALRTLNDAKSAYGHFHFAPAFFERCSAPPRPDLVGGRGRKRQDESAGRKRSRSRSRGAGAGRSESSSDDSNNDDEDEDDGRLLCRVPLRAVHAVLRSRKGVSTLRIRSLGAAPLSQTQSQQDNDTNNDGRRGTTAAATATASPGGEDETTNLRMQLSFEFVSESTKTGGTMRIVHRVGVSDADGVAAVATRSGCSEIVSPPTVILRLLDPLKRTTEVALTIDDVGRAATATSFHHGDAVAATSSSAADNALLNAAAAAVLKTETSIAIDEFVEYNWRDDRKLARGDDGDDEEEDETPGGNPPPSKVNEEVTLVFSIKEAKAMLQFCAQASHDIEMDAIVSFHWGGRPVIIDAEEESGAFRVELILATLDHKLLGRGVRSRAPSSSAAGGGGRGGSSSARRGSGSRSAQ